jgi:hypothetical protein
LYPPLFCTKLLLDFQYFFGKSLLTNTLQNVVRPLNINVFQGGTTLMPDIFLHNLNQTLDNCISALDSIHDLFCLHPGTDFSRNRKIILPILCNALIQMQI